MQRWYVVHTHSRTEAKAVVNLRRQGYVTYLPRYLKLRRHARRSERVPVPLFPRYLFVRMDIDATPWRAIQSTVGVVHLITQNGRPAPVPEGVVQEIRGCEGSNGMVEMAGLRVFRKGDRVQLLRGALAEHVGLFQEMVDDQRIIVLLDLLGRQNRVLVPADAIEATV